MTNKNRLGNLYDVQCAKIAVVVGTGIHLYSLAINNNHFQGICEDFENGEFFRVALKTTVPILLPYFVSLYSRKKAKEEIQRKVNDLEQKMSQLED